MLYVAGRGLAALLGVAVVAALAIGAARPPAVGAATPHVIVISVDGLRPDAVTQLGAGELPSFFRLRNEGAFTDNGRTDYEYTITLPNHGGMLTGRAVTGDAGHAVTFASDPGGIIHGLNPAVPYVASVFDVVHDRGGSTALYASKPKFALFDRSWDGASGAPDTLGADNGRDKIDTFVFSSDTDDLVDQFIADMATSPYAYSFVHLADPDAAGHSAGWMSAAYLDAVRDVDAMIGRIIGLVETQPELGSNTVLIVTSDHGGSSTGHTTAGSPESYTIPLYVWGADVTGGSLYDLNQSSRSDPLGGRPGPAGSPPPIRNGDVANLALDMLGLPSVGGSTINPAQDLSVAGPPGAPLVAVFNPESGRWRVRMPDGGFVDMYFGVPGDFPLLGDWDCDGSDTPAVYRRSSGEVFLTNQIATGLAQAHFFFGGPGDYPVAGDWDGDGCDSVAIYRDGEVFITNRLATGRAEFSFPFGSGRQVPFAGDFDGSGSDSLGLYARASGKVVVSPTLPAGGDELTFFYGQSLDRAVVGDWDRDGIETIGIFRPEDGRFYMANANQQQSADLIWDLGEPGWLPVAGAIVP